MVPIISIQIELTISETNELSTRTETRVIDLRDRVNRLKQKFTENEFSVQRASEAAKVAEDLANKADRVMDICLPDIPVLSLPIVTYSL